MHITASARLTPGDVSALEHDGFIALHLGPSIAASIERIYDFGLAYFRLPLEFKLKDSIADELGYRPTGIEYSQSPDRPDPCESFSANLRTSPENANLHTGLGRTLYGQMTMASKLLERIAENILTATADAFGATGSSLSGALQRWCVLQLNYSRPAAAFKPFVHETHEDGHLLTLASATGPGLEIAHADGSFRQYLARDALLIMPGEILWLLTGGRIKPLFHRVVALPDVTERLALLFFTDLDPRRCIPWIRNDVNAGVDIGHRVLTNAERFGLTGFDKE